MWLQPPSPCPVQGRRHPYRGHPAHHHTFSLLPQPPGPQRCQFCHPAHGGPNSGTISHHVRSPPACLCPELLICLQAALQLSSLLHQESTEACVVPILDEATRLKHPAEDEDLPELEKARTKTTKAAKPRCTNTQHLHVLFAQLHVSPQDPGAFIPLRALPKGLYRRKTIHSGKSISEY